VRSRQADCRGSISTGTNPATCKPFRDRRFEDCGLPSRAGTFARSTLRTANLGTGSAELPLGAISPDDPESA
jgi:hypothetical protein